MIGTEGNVNADGVRLRNWRAEDVPELVRLADNRRVADQLRDAFPHPYTAECGRAWVAFVNSSPPATPSSIFPAATSSGPGSGTRSASGGGGVNVVPLDGRWVRLVPLDESHREPLRQAADDDRIWAHTLTRGGGPGFDAWFDDALAERAAGRRVPFAVGRVGDGRWVGSTSYLDVTPRHRRVEIGSTWYHPDAWGTAVNPECKLLLLAHAFEVLGVNRVALVTDALNARSQAAIARLGAVREGVLRAHMVSQGGRVRDSVVFGVVAADWPAVRAGLVARLAGYADPTAG